MVDMWHTRRAEETGRNALLYNILRSFKARASFFFNYLLHLCCISCLTVSFTLDEGVLWTDEKRHERRCSLHAIVSVARVQPD